LYIRDSIRIFDMSSGIDTLGIQTIHMCMESESMRQAIDSLLSSADTGIEEIHIETKTYAAPWIASNMSEQLTHIINSWAEIAASSPLADVVASRRDHAGNSVQFDFKTDESQGTQRFFALAGPLLSALSDAKFIVVDELDASMHPLLTRRLLEIFQNSDPARDGAQMLFTTHDSSLLDQDLFRRDQIWLAEKCDGASTFFSLADIKPPIRNTESFLRNYLVGRYGGTPHLGRAFDDLIAGSKA